jgi:hypothetical protein
MDWWVSWRTRTIINANWTVINGAHQEGFLIHQESDEKLKHLNHLNWWDQIELYLLFCNKRCSHLISSPCYIFKASLTPGYPLVVWRQVKVMFIQKPVSENYTKAKATVWSVSHHFTQNTGQNGWHTNKWCGNKVISLALRPIGL